MDNIDNTYIIHIPADEDIGTETIWAEKIGEDTFKLLEAPIFNCRLSYGVIVKARLDENQEWVFVKVQRASEFYTRKFLFSPTAKMNYDALREKIGNCIVEAGGEWEVVFGGMAYVHLPKDSTFQLDELFKELGYFPTEIVD